MPYHIKQRPVTGVALSYYCFSRVCKKPGKPPFWAVSYVRFFERFLLPALSKGNQNT
jgi:hypothetical protein